MSESLPPLHPILLLGATGKIGLEIRKALQVRAARSTVICCSRQPFDGPRFPNENWLTFDPFTADWTSLPKVAVIVNAIGAIQETPEMPFERVHLGLTRILLAHRAALGHPRIVQLSALGAHVDQANAFLQTKGAADALLLQAHDTVVLRPSIVCTPQTMLSQKIASLLKIARFSFGKLLVPKGFAATQIQPIMGADVGSAVANAAMRGDLQGCWELVGPQRICFGELIGEMAAAQGRSLRLVEVSREIIESFVKHFVAVWFPELINHAQFQLLFQDNVGELNETVELLEKQPEDTLPFWRAEAIGAHPAPPTDHERDIFALPSAEIVL